MPPTDDVTQCDCEPDQPHSDSAKLAANMIRKGITKPAGWATHHIVPGALNYDGDGDRVRAILQRFGIGINDAANGVFLECGAGGTTAPHNNLHTVTYLENVRKDLEAAGSTGDVNQVLQTLRQIGDKLANDTYPWRNP